MTANYQPPDGEDGTLSSLNEAIDALNLAKGSSTIAPAKAAFSAVTTLLSTISKDSMINEVDLVELGLACADVCRALDRGTKGRHVKELNQFVLEAISQLTTTVAEILGKMLRWGKRNAISPSLHKEDKEIVTAWRLDLDGILHVFNTQLARNTHGTASDAHQDVNQNRTTQNSLPGEFPPPPPRVFFGRDQLIEEIVSLVENLTPIALIGVGGIGKTSIALTVLHDDRIKQRFGDNRRFIRCDQFSPSLTNLLRQLSKAIGAGINNPEDMTPLRPFLSSKEMLIILDNAESILDPHGPYAEEIYAAVEELSGFSNICLCITSRISIIPPHCETFDIPTLSMEAARDTFYRIYRRGEQSDTTNGILEQLEFHPLSITLLATVAQHSKWDATRLSKEWKGKRTDVLRAQPNKSLAVAIELSLSSLMFQALGPDARDLLGVVAFFPQGVDEKNLDWLFPTIPSRRDIFDTFCILSLTYRSDDFVTMLAPLRDHLRPKDPMSVPLLRSTKDHYFSRLSVDVDPDKPGFEEAQWITSEDANVEHLLDAFITIDGTSDGVWGVCASFMHHLRWHKPRLIVLGPKIGGLPDDHPSKPECLYRLALLFLSVGNYAESKQLLTHTLELQRERGDDHQVAYALGYLSDANLLMGFHEEGIQQIKEASAIAERCGSTLERAQCLTGLAQLLYGDGRLDAAEEAASRAINLLLGNDGQFLVCLCHEVLGKVYRAKDKTEEAINHFEVALGIASSFNWHARLFWIYASLVELFLHEDRFDDAHTHIEHAKSHTVNEAYLLVRGVGLQARFWWKQRRFEEAKSEVLHAIDSFEKLGATKDAEDARTLLRQIDDDMAKLVTLDEPDDDSWVTASE